MNKSQKLSIHHYNEWTSADWQRATALTLIPGSVLLVGMACSANEKQHMNWWKVRQQTKTKHFYFGIFSPVFSLSLGIASRTNLAQAKNRMLEFG
jgi:hypothetical protein